jgi:hypothetical protein
MLRCAQHDNALALLLITRLENCTEVFDHDSSS